MGFYTNGSTQIGVIGPARHGPFTKKTLRQSHSKGRYLSRVLNRTVVRSLVMWSLLKQFSDTISPKRRKNSTIPDPIHSTMRLLSEYAKLVAETGFDSAAAVKFKAEHADDNDFVTKAALHDRMVFRTLRFKEAKINQDRKDRER